MAALNAVAEKREDNAVRDDAIGRRCALRVDGIDMRLGGRGRCGNGEREFRAVVMGGRALQSGKILGPPRRNPLFTFNIILLIMMDIMARII